MSIVSIRGTATDGTTAPGSTGTAYNPGTVSFVTSADYTVSDNIITYIGSTSSKKAFVTYNITYTTDQTSGNTAFYIYQNGVAIPITFQHRTNNASALINVSILGVITMNTGDTLQVFCIDESGAAPTITSDTFIFSIIS